MLSVIIVIVILLVQVFNIAHTSVHGLFTFLPHLTNLIHGSPTSVR